MVIKSSGLDDQLKADQAIKFSGIRKAQNPTIKTLAKLIHAAAA